MNFARTVRELQNERAGVAERLDKLDEAIAALRTLTGRGRRIGPGRTRVGKRHLSTAARRKIAAAQRARWAKWKAKHRRS
jgi:hypothetical protein